MSKNDDSGRIGERRGTGGFVRVPDGDQGWQPQGGVPGKRTAVPEGRPVDPVTAFLRRLDAIGGRLDGIAARHLPAMRAAITTRAMDDARRTGGELAAALGSVDADLTAMKQQALLLESAAALTMLAPLEARRDACRVDAAPLLAQVPPPAPALSLDAAFAPHLCLEELAQHDAAEADTRAAWSAELDASEETHAATNVIDAGDRFRRSDEAPAVVQRRTAGSPTDPKIVHAHAAAGVAGSGSPLPHLDPIQRSFGAHDVTGIRAHVGGPAADASAAIGAEAYATGTDVAFASSPSLFVAAHEAAHVVQQRAGVSLLGGIGEAGDAYEHHADAVAEAVVRGESAEGLLGDARQGAAAPAVQRSPRADDNTGDRLPDLEIEPRRVDLGSVKVGETGTVIVYVHNRDEAEVWIDEPAVAGSAAFTASFADAGGKGVAERIAPEDYGAIRITFKPAAFGAHDGTMQIVTPDGTGFTIPLHGVGALAVKPQQDEPDSPPSPFKEQDRALKPLEAVPDRMSLVEPLGSRRVVTQTIWNNDAVTRYLDDEVISGSNAFTMEGVSRSAIPAGGTTEVRIGFDAKSESVELAVLHVTAQKGPGVDVSLMGRGEKAQLPDRRPEPKPAPEDPSPAQPKLVEDNSLAIVTSTIDFGEVSVDIPTTREVHIFNQSPAALQIGPLRLDTQSAAMQAEATNSIAAAKSDAPSYLRHVLAEPVRVTFAPFAAGRFDNVLRFELYEGMYDGARRQSVEVTIKARARAVGAAPSEDEATRIAREEAERTEAAESEAAKQRIAELAKRNRGDLPRDVDSDLNDAFTDAKTYDDRLVGQQSDGVDLVKDEAEHYAREQPAMSSSVLTTLAELALFTAASAISAGLVPAFEVVFASYSRAQETTYARTKAPAEGGLNWVEHKSDGKLAAKVAADSVKEVLKALAKYAVGTFKSPAAPVVGPSATSESDASLNPLLAFFDGQKDALTRESLLHYDALKELRAQLRILAHIAPEAAVAALQGYAAAHLAFQEAAKREQSDASRLAWIRAVASATVGTSETDRDGNAVTTETVTNLDGVAKAPNEDHETTAPDGILKLTFDADVGRPGRPVVPTSAHLAGISQEIAGQLETQDLRRAHLPILAVGRPGGMSQVAVIPVAITQDEAGTISVDGDLDYLSRKADPSRGDVPDGRALQDPNADGVHIALAHEGGRKVMNELLAEPLGNRGVEITTDDATGNR